MTLTAEELARYHRDGVLAPLRVLPEARAYRERCDEVFAALGPDRRRDHVSQWHLCFRWAYDLALEPAVLAAVCAVIGPDVIVHSSTLFHKPPDGRSFVPWHQDGHYWRMDSTGLVSAWIALSPSTVGSGCLRVIRGSHHHDRVDHRVRPDADSLLAGLELNVEVDERDAIDAELRPGEMSLHHLNAVHGSRPNAGTEPRVGFAVRYAAAGVRQERVHHEVVAAAGDCAGTAFRVLPAPPPDDLPGGLAAQERTVAWIREHLSPLNRGEPAGENNPDSAPPAGYGVSYPPSPPSRGRGPG